MDPVKAPNHLEWPFCVGCRRPCVSTFVGARLVFFCPCPGVREPDAVRK